VSSLGGTFQEAAWAVSTADQFLAIASCSVLDEGSQSVAIKISYRGKGVIGGRACNVTAIASVVKAIAFAVEAIASVIKAIADNIEAIASVVKVIAFAPPGNP
jgi:hypothetical protein